MDVKVQKMIMKAYNEIEDKEKKNSITQGLSGALGFPFTLGADVGVIAALYAPMFSNIRRTFGRTSNQNDKIVPLISNITSEILFDLVADKVLGNIAIIGIYFNAICARAMTWRLGILFTMLAARGEDINEKHIKDAVKLIRLTFPQKKAFRFTKPDYYTFKKLISEFHDISETEFSKKISSDISSVLNLPDM
ncbi:hypothetical protein [Clostridium sp. DL1XJH146]